MEGCRAVLENDRLVLENDCLRRGYAWNHGHLISQALADRATGRVWTLSGDVPDMAFPGADLALSDGELSVSEQPETAFLPAHLRVDVIAALGVFQVRRRFRIYPGCPAIACDLSVRLSGKLSGGSPLLQEAPDALLKATIERLSLPQPHLRLECVQFYDITDRRNTLVTSRSVLPYRQEGVLSGNVLLIRDPFSEDGLFILKEAPCSDVQLAYPGYDFAHRIGEIRVAGLGLEWGDLRRGEWVRGYGFVTGVAGGGELGLLSALRTYQENVRLHRPERDDMILLNTWGDRGQDTKIRESFALAELERAAQLGITHFQLDDGWQAGRSSNSAFEGGSLEDIWSRTCYWTPHPDRFPDGLGPVVERSRELGIELCLWFNPSRDDSYAHWQDDAAVLIDLYETYRIRTFKIDGVIIPDKAADERLRAMFERVMEATGGEAVFNLDVTAGRRWGYHYGNEYGNVFLENRYTDWCNHYPHWTLRNLWMLSRYLPPQNLQIEFLNKWRNVDRYPANDPLAPQRIPFDYCFAITMVAQPLAWFEATGLPEEAFEITPLIHVYRAHQERLHAGQILPIGEEPSGTSWTGFQSMRKDGGYLCLYREGNDRDSAVMRLWGLVGKRVRLRRVAGWGESFGDVVSADGQLRFRLPEPFTYVFYEYQVV
jgi:alpha-galactosidase